MTELTPTELAAQRAKLLADYVAEYPMHDRDSEPTAEAAAERRYLLVEENVHGHEPPYWLSLHNSPQDAADYHTGQEYPEDWAIVTLVDLDDGRTFDHEATIVFTPSAEPAE